jgi:hypothetical protein
LGAGSGGRLGQSSRCQLPVVCLHPPSATEWLIELLTVGEIFGLDEAGGEHLRAASLE